MTLPGRAVGKPMGPKDNPVGRVGLAVGQAVESGVSEYSLRFGKH